MNCSSDLKTFANSRPSASNVKSFSRSLEQFFLTVGQNNFGNKIPFICLSLKSRYWGWKQKRKHWSLTISTTIRSENQVKSRHHLRPACRVYQLRPRPIQDCWFVCKKAQIQPGLLQPEFEPFCIQSGNPLIGLERSWLTRSAGQWW